LLTVIVCVGAAANANGKALMASSRRPSRICGYLVSTPYSDSLGKLAGIRSVEPSAFLGEERLTWSAAPPHNL
jgi:hypothetical protein